MKKITLLICLISISCIAFSQPQKDSVAEEHTTCYQRYAKVFQKRGAYNVPDGEYDGVIITFRRQGSTECYMGRVLVEEGAVDLDKMYLKFVDDTYDHVKVNYKYKDAITIINGMSKTIVTIDDELVNVLFISKIKPKQKAYEQAPLPSFDL